MGVNWCELITTQIGDDSGKKLYENAEGIECEATPTKEQTNFPTIKPRGMLALLSGEL